MTSSSSFPSLPVCHMLNHPMLPIMKPFLKIFFFNVTLCNPLVILRNDSFKGEVYLTKYAT